MNKFISQETQKELDKMRREQEETTRQILEEIVGLVKDEPPKKRGPYKKLEISN